MGGHAIRSQRPYGSDSVCRCLPVGWCQCHELAVGGGLGRQQQQPWAELRGAAHQAQAAPVIGQEAGEDSREARSQCCPALAVSGVADSGCVVVWGGGAACRATTRRWSEPRSSGGEAGGKPRGAMAIKSAIRLPLVCVCLLCSKERETRRQAALERLQRRKRQREEQKDRHRRRLQSSSSDSSNTAAPASNQHEAPPKPSPKRVGSSRPSRSPGDKASSTDGA